jgi:hypothetical protein
MTTLFWFLAGVGSLFLGMIAALIASARGGDGILGFILGLLFGPFGIVAAFYLGDEKSRERKDIDLGYRKRCRDCAELVKTEARICKYCGCDFEALELCLQPDAR